MTNPSPDLVYVDLYQTAAPMRVLRPRRAQRWRWRALNGNNSRVLAASSEAYTNRDDALAAINQLFGANSNVYLRSGVGGNQLLRLAVQS
ncbi:hypothetical protein [Mycobacterium colombiense]